jgi:hypothetical protein
MFRTIGPSRNLYLDRNLFFVFAAYLILTGCAAPIDPDPPAATATNQIESAGWTATSPAGDPDARIARASPPATGQGAAIPPPAAISDAAIDPTRPIIEEITVHPTDLSGFWRLYVPRDLGVEIGLFSGVRLRFRRADPIGYVCRFDQRQDSVTGNCLALGGPAHGGLDGNRLNITWWTGPATLRLDADLVSADAISGGFSGGVLGMNLTAHLPARAERLAPRGEAAEPAEVAAALRQVLADLAQGHVTAARYTPEEADRLRRRLAAGPPDAGLASPLVSATYLDRAAITRRKLREDEAIEVFDARFERGAALCGIALAADGRIADFRWQAE